MENQYRKWLGERRGRKAVEAFGNRGWTAYYAETLAEARELLFGTCLPLGVSVGLGGSETLKALDVLPELRSGKYRLYDRYRCEDHFEVCRDSLMADYFLSSANALTMAGEMVNLDCSGSRVAALAYGPRRIIVIAGVNKLTGSLEQGIARARAIAPMNCKRNGHRTPCAETGLCPEAAGKGEGCNIPDRMCNQLLITFNAQKFAGKYQLIIVNEDLGF